MDEKQLIKELKQTDTSIRAFECLVNKYKEKLYWHIRQMVLTHEDADDILQDTFIKVWKNISSFKGEAQLFTWIYRIATNETLNFLRKQKNQTKISEENQQLILNKLSSDPWFCGDQAQIKLQQAIATLPDKQRLVFNMKYFEDLKYNEMAAILDTSEGALKASYHHAVKKIKEIILAQEVEQ